VEKLNWGWAHPKTIMEKKKRNINFDRAMSCSFGTDKTEALHFMPFLVGSIVLKRALLNLRGKEFPVMPGLFRAGVVTS
jgi:hypothetical protein